MAELWRLTRDLQAMSPKVYNLWIGLYRDFLNFVHYTFPNAEAETFAAHDTWVEPAFNILDLEEYSGF